MLSLAGDMALNWTVVNDTVRLSAKLSAANVVEMSWLTTMIGDSGGSETRRDGSKTFAALFVVGFADFTTVTSCGNVTDSCVLGRCDVSQPHVSLPDIFQ